MAAQWEYTYEASDEASENELLDRSLSVWRGGSPYDSDDDFSPTALDIHTASSIGQYDCVRNIIQRGENVNRKNRGGWTPLMYASYIGHDNIVNLLLDSGVDVNVRNNKGQSSLLLAASCGNESIAYFLKQAGGDTEAKDKKGWTALFHATYCGHQNMVSFLLEKHANAELVEPTMNYTPLMQAAAAGHEIIVQYLLQHGVKVNTKQAYTGQTARTLALIHGHMKIVSLIDTHMLGPAHHISRDAGHRGEKELSSSDEAYQHPRHISPRNSKNKVKGPSIHDGPQAFAKLMHNRGQGGSPTDGQTNGQEHYPANSCVPSGYMTFKDDCAAADVTASEIRSRDVTSPIRPEDHTDSSTGRDSTADVEDSTCDFSKTGALTIKSSSGSSGGLVAALGISRQNSTDSTDDGRSSRSDCADHAPRPGPISKPSPPKGHKTKGEGSRDGHRKERRRSGHQPPSVAPCPLPNQTPAQQVLHNGEGQKYVPTSTNRLSAGTQQEQIEILANRPPDLSTFLTSLGLAKYIPIFEEQDVDLPVFLSLTDIDLKEVGIKLFGPRRKMTNAIARWHSNARPSGHDLEQAYADKLEAEMQEMAVRLHQAYEQIESLKAQLLQERELRSVTESCLMEDRLSWQHVHHIAADMRQRCGDMHELMHNVKRYHNELTRRLEFEPAILPAHSEHNSLVTAIQEGLSLDNNPYEPSNDITRLSTPVVLRKLQRLHDEVHQTINMTASNTDKLMGKNVDYSNL